MISIDNTIYIAEFERVLGSNIHKEKLVSILESRLNGSFEPNAIVNDKNMVSFDFEKNLTEEQKYYLDYFNEYYYSKPLIQLEYFNKIVNPIVLKIEENYNNIINFMNVKPESLKHSLLFINSFGDNQYNLNTLFEFCLILSKLDKLEEIIVHYFHSILDPNFNIKNLIDMNKPIGFHKLYNLLTSHICDKIYMNKIESLLASYDSKDKEQKNLYLTMFRKSKKILNALFWIIYANEFKFIDNIQNKYLILTEYLLEYDKKITEWFQHEDEIICENGEKHINKINLFEELIERMDDLENNVVSVLEKKAEEARILKLEDDMEKILEIELDKYIDNFTKDEEERKFYKNQFKINIQFVIMIEKFDKIIDVLETNKSTSCK